MQIDSRLPGFFLSLLLTGVLPGCSSEVPVPVGDPADSAENKTGTTGEVAQQEIVDLLVTFNTACGDGDLTTYRKLMCTSKLKRLEEILADSGQELKPDQIRGPNSSLIDPSQWRVTHFRQKEDHARLQFLINDASRLDLGLGPMDVAVSLVVFRKESDGWKFFAATVHKVAAASLDENKCWPEADIPSVMVDALEYESFKK